MSVVLNISGKENFILLVPDSRMPSIAVPYKQQHRFHSSIYVDPTTDQIIISQNTLKFNVTVAGLCAVMCVCKYPETFLWLQKYLARVHCVRNWKQCYRT